MLTYPPSLLSDSTGNVGLDVPHLMHPSWLLGKTLYPLRTWWFMDMQDVCQERVGHPGYG